MIHAVLRSIPAIGICAVNQNHGAGTFETGAASSHGGGSRVVLLLRNI